MIEEWTAASILKERLGIEADPEWPSIWVSVEMEGEDAVTTFQCGTIIKAWWKDGIAMISHATGIEEHRVDQAVSATIREWVEQND